MGQTNPQISLQSFSCLPGRTRPPKTLGENFRDLFCQETGPQCSLKDSEKWLPSGSLSFPGPQLDLLCKNRRKVVRGALCAFFSLWGRPRLVRKCQLDSSFAGCCRLMRRLGSTLGPKVFFENSGIVTNYSQNQKLVGEPDKILDPLVQVATSVCYN